MYKIYAVGSQLLMRKK